MDQVQKNVCQINRLVSDWEKKYHRKPGSVKVLAASKKQSLEKIKSAILGGQRIFGENYLQEALGKMESLQQDDLEWHFIGPIQTNKTKKIAEHFSWVQSVDQRNIARRLNEKRPLHLPPLNICIEININYEKTKSGIFPEHLLAFLQDCQVFSRLKVRGIMAIPAIENDFAKQRKVFRNLFSLWQQAKLAGFDLDTLSMGMTNDMEAAIAEGSTLVRIGTGIFGARGE